jgi:hypothetical protein
MMGFRSRVVVALASSTLLASGLSVAALAGAAESVTVSSAGASQAHPCPNATLIDYCLRG